MQFQRIPFNVRVKHKPSLFQRMGIWYWMQRTTDQYGMALAIDMKNHTSIRSLDRIIKADSKWGNR